MTVVTGFHCTCQPSDKSLRKGYTVSARRPFEGVKQLNPFPLGKKFHFYANDFLVFTPPTWSPRTDSIHFCLTYLRQWQFNSSRYSLINKAKKIYLLSYSFSLEMFYWNNLGFCETAHLPLPNPTFCPK